MSELSIRDRVHRIIVTHLCCDEDQVKDETVLTDDLGADSLDVVELGMEFEDQFGVVISDGDMAEVRTVADAVRLIERKKG